MTAKPLIFSAPRIRALLDGRKTMTRRILKPQPPKEEDFPGSSFGLDRAVDDCVKMYSQNDYDRLPKHPTKWQLLGSIGVARDAGFPDIYDARFGVGDHLWVKERYIPDAPADHDAWDDWKCSFTEWDGCGRALDMVPPALRSATHVIFGADPIWAQHQDWKWRNSMYMPRWASRITLKVIAVKVERLTTITDAEAIAEGLTWVSPTWGVPGAAASWSADPRFAFGFLWTSIHGPGSWEANPYVVALTFEVIKKNVDDVLREAKPC